MEMKALEDLLLNELMELYSAEQQIAKALPKMVKVTHNTELRAAFELHSKQTAGHVKRLNKIFTLLNKNAETADCEPITEMVKQADSLAGNRQSDPAIVDAALISAAQKVEHYEIALYGTARSHAQLLGYRKIGDILTETLREEEETDALLTKLAQKRVNLIAAKAPFGEARTGPRGSTANGWGAGALIGSLAIGAAAAMFYSSKPGEQMRRELKARAQGVCGQTGADEQRTMEDEGYIQPASSIPL